MTSSPRTRKEAIEHLMARGFTPFFAEYMTDRLIASNLLVVYGPAVEDGHLVPVYVPAHDVAIIAISRP